jgi:hypothetical protein
MLRAPFSMRKPYKDTKISALNHMLVDGEREQGCRRQKVVDAIETNNMAASVVKTGRSFEILG